VPQILGKLKRGERIDHFEIDRVRKDGTRIDVSLNISPVKDTTGKVVAASTIAREFTERKRVEDHRDLLMAELDHRVKNILMVITSLVSQTMRNAGSSKDFAEDIQGRIQALSRVHNLLNVHHQTHAQLRDIVAGELSVYRSDREDRIVIDGKADVHLTGKTTQTLAMAMHELATNAAKYGALSTAAGSVAVRWSVLNSAEPPRLSIEWVESGGPPVKTPTRQGFGSQLIEKIVNHELEADVRREFKTEGLRCQIEFSLTEKTGYLSARGA
jgi:two-component system CheB/CheR fusion protein